MLAGLASQVGLIGAVLLFLAYVLLQRRLRSIDRSLAQSNQQILGQLAVALLREAVQSEAHRVVFGEPNDSRPRLPRPVVEESPEDRDSSMELEESSQRVARALIELSALGKKIDQKVFEGCESEVDRWRRLTERPIVSPLYPDGEIPVWLETQDGWQELAPIPLFVYLDLLGRIQKSFAPIPDRKDSILPEYIRIPWSSDKDSLYIKAQLHLEDNHCFSLELQDWTRA